MRTESRTWLAQSRHAALAAGRWCAVFSLFAVTINKPATNVAVVLSFVFSLMGSDLGLRWKAAARHPVARGFLVWWVVLMLSALHTWFSTSRLPLGGSYVWVCLYPLVFASLLQSSAWQRRALFGFAIGVALTLAISYGMALGVIPQRTVTLTQPNMVDTVFKEYTQQGLALLIAASMALAASLIVRSRRIQFLLLALVALAVVNIVFMIESRTSYVVLLALAAFWVWRLCLTGHTARSSRLLVYGLCFAALTATLLIPTIRQRLIDSVAHETQQYLHHRVPTSTGVRLELWRDTMPMLASAPIFGHGLHQWAPLYKQIVKQKHVPKGFVMGHPHQEMLLILAEQGAVGLLVFLTLLVALARYIWRLAPPERDIYASILLIYLVAGLANCLWADFTHRHVFVLLLACIPLARGTMQIQDDEARPPL